MVLAEIKAYIKKHPTIKKVYVVSGTGVIPVSVESELKALGISSVERVAGKDRYDTSLAIAQKFYPKALAGSLASGMVFADALSGSRNAWVYNSPILLVKKDFLIIQSLAYVGNKRRVWILGGPATVSDPVTEYYLASPLKDGTEFSVPFFIMIDCYIGWIKKANQYAS